MEAQHFTYILWRIEQHLPCDVTIEMVNGRGSAPSEIRELHDAGHVRLSDESLVLLEEARENDWSWRQGSGCEIQLTWINQCAGAFINMHDEFREIRMTRKGALAMHMPQSDPTASPWDNVQRFRFQEQVLSGSLQAFFQEWGLRLEIRFGSVIPGVADFSTRLLNGNEVVASHFVCGLTDVVFDPDSKEKLGVFVVPDQFSDMVLRVAQSYIKEQLGE